MTLSRAVSVVAILATLPLAACVSAEERAITQYVSEAETLAEQLTDAAATFETLMNAQPDPLAWTEESKAEISTILGTFQGLHRTADAMTVPPAFIDVHPLLVEALSEMAAAVEIIHDIAQDPASVSMAKANDMSAKADHANQLAEDYVEQLEQTLRTEYPAMMEE